MSTAILTDTNSGIYAEEAAKLGIFVIPTPIIIDGKTYFEGETISHGDFFQRLEEGTSVHTSQPSPESVMKMWDQILADYDDLVYIPLSSGLSGSAQTARLLAGEYGGRVQVADNHRISVTMRQSVEDARAMVSRGLSAPEIRAELERMAFDSTIFLGVETLKYLKNGGRVTPAAAAVATILNIKPLLIIKGEKLDQFATVRGTMNCRKREIEEMRKVADAYRKSGRRIRVGAAGSFVNPEDAEAWKKQVEDAFPEEVRYDPLSLVVCVHTGPDSFGMGISACWEG